MNGERTPRHEYPKCPRCGGPVAAAMMTSDCIKVLVGIGEVWTIYYAPSALSVYCVLASCNYDHKLSDLTTPVPAAQEVKP